MMCKNGDPKCKNSDAKCKNSDTGNWAIPKKELWSASFKWKGESLPKYETKKNVCWGC